MNWSLLKVSAAAVAVAAVSLSAQAVDYSWTGGGTDTNYSTPANWGVESGYPGSEDAARFLEGAAGKTVTFDGAYTPSYVWTATGDKASPVTWEGSGSVTTTWNIGCADNVGQVGALTINSGTYNAGGGFNFGSGTGVLTMNGGTVNAGGVSYWGTEANADFNATINSGATVNFNGIDGYTSLRMMNGTGITGIINIDGGTFAVNGGDLELGLGNSDATSQTTINISNDGVFSVGNATERWTILGSAGTGKATINVNDGGTFAFWRIAHNGTGECELNVDGGTLKILGRTWNYDNGTFAADNDASFTVTIGKQGATLDTNGFDVKIPKTLKGSGTLTITGGGSVLFTVQPECTIVADGATYTIQDENFYWTGNGDGVNWSDGSNWSKGAVPGADDDVVFNKAATVTIAETEVKSVAVNAAVTFNGGATLRLGSGGMSGSGTLTLAGANLRSATTTTASVDIVLADGSTNKFIVGADGANFTISGKVSSQEFGTGVLEITQGTGRNNANAGVKLTGDWSDFAGSIVYYQSWGSTSGVRTYQQRAMDTFTRSATSANARWDVYATTYDIDLMRANGHFFAESGTAEAPAVYKFGSLKMRLPNNKNDTGYSSYVMLEVGNLNEDSSLLYSWRGAQNCGVRWIAPTATFGSYAANTAYIDIVGGGNVEFSASGVPTAINFKEKGGYVVLTSDATLNAAILAAITTVDLDEGGVVGFCYDGETELIVDVSSKAALLGGKTIAKKGSGTLSITGVPGETACDVAVNDGALVLPHGAVVGDVTVAQGASLVIDMIGAEDNEVVFAYASVTGDVIDRNTASIGKIEKDDEAKTWTYVVTGSARTFKWNGEEVAAWTEASNWLIVDDESETTATDIPSTIDTVLFDKNATISASGTLAGDVQIAEGVTLTIPAGLTFSKLTAASGAKIAFSADPISTVGGTLTLISVGQGAGVSDAFDLPPTYSVGVDAVSGAFTATRTSGTYTWTNAKEDNNWATSGNWKVDDFVVPEVPAAEDTVAFPASDAEGFKAWTVTLPWDVYADTVTLNAAVELSGARTLKAHTINGSSELKLNNAHIGCNGMDMIVTCPLNILPETTDYIYLMGYNATLKGALYGSGKLVSDANGAQYKGVTFKGDVSEFYGEFESTKYNQRDATNMTAPAIGSENAVWRTNPHPGTGSAQQANHFVIHDNSTLYKFGAYVGGFWVGDITTPHIEIGHRDDVASSFSLTSYGSRSRFVITKVGSNSMTVTNGKGDPQIGTLYPNDGASIIYTTPETITFGGGALKTPIYETITGKAIKYIYVNATDATDERVLDEDAGTSFTDEKDVVYNYKESKEVDVSGPYYPDVSSVIKDSTGPIWFDTDDADYTWAATLDYSNKGGLTKSGSGTLTLATEPNYTGVTWVQAGTLVVPEGTSITLDPRSLGTVSGVTVENYAYRPDTVLDGTEAGDDDLTGNIDVSGIQKIDISDPSYVTALVNQRRVVLCGTTGSITGLNFRHFVQGEKLLVPERPEGVSEKNWDWSVRIMQVDGKRCLCVAPRVVPYTIRIR